MESLRLCLSPVKEDISFSVTSGCVLFSLDFLFMSPENTLGNFFVFVLFPPPPFTLIFFQT